jgi:competence protein ComEA
MNMLRKLVAAALVALAFAIATPSFAGQQVDINSAGAKALAEGMNGVGLRKAEAIVAYRETHGPFHSTAELAKVKGIGPRTLEKNRDTIIVGQGARAQAETGRQDRPKA